MKKLLALCSGLCLLLGIGANVYAYQVNPPAPKVYTCPKVPTNITIGFPPGSEFLWHINSNALATGTVVVFDNETTLQYNGIGTVPRSGDPVSSNKQSVQCNYTILDSKAGKAYDMEIVNVEPVKNCTKLSSSSLKCDPA